MNEIFLRKFILSKNIVPTTNKNNYYKFFLKYCLIPNNYQLTFS